MSCDRAGPALSTHRGDANDAERPDGVRWKPARGGGGGGAVGRLGWVVGSVGGTSRKG